MTRWLKVFHFNVRRDEEFSLPEGWEPVSVEQELSRDGRTNVVVVGVRSIERSTSQILAK